jgi:hypothetical protein
MMGYWAYKLVSAAAEGEKLPESVDVGYAQ